MPHCFPPSPRFKIVSLLPRVPQFQSRPEVDRLFDWWRGGDAPVCVLVGPDGAGKTAIVDRFLRILSDKMASTERGGDARGERRIDDALPLPEAVFVCPLHAVPNPGGLFARLVSWLNGEAFVDTDPRPSALETLDRLRQIVAPERRPPAPVVAVSADRPATPPRLLLVLDGVEKLQPAVVGAKNPAGVDAGGPDGIPPAAAIGSDGIGLLIRRVAAGRLPGVRLLLTARLSIPFLEYAETENPIVFEIPVDGLSRSDAIALLRKRALKGFDADLDAVAERGGRHALSLHLAACFLRTFHEGDSVTGGLDFESVASGDSSGATSVESRGATMAALLRLFLSRLDLIDRALRPLLERAALFRLGFTAEILATLFVGAPKKDVCGDALAALHSDEVPSRLARLAELGLLETYPGDRYAVHPALREPILASMDGEALRAGHDRIRRALETVPGGRPALGEATENPVALDLLEEIVHHSLATHHIREAFNIYWYRMGGSQNLGMALGDFERGERVCRAILSALPAESDGEESVYLQAVRPALRNDLALYLDGLGRTDDAATVHQLCIDDASRNGETVNEATSLLNLADVLIQQGRLSDARLRVERALSCVELLGVDEMKQTAYAMNAYVRFLLGDIEVARDDFERARLCQAAVDAEADSLYSGRGIWYARFLMGIGRVEEARALTERNKAICLQHFGDDEPTTPRCNVFLAETAAGKGDLDEARSLIEKSRRWALGHASKGLFVEIADVDVLIAVTAARKERTTGRTIEETAEGNPVITAACDFAEALARLDDALILAQECGYVPRVERLIRRRTEALELPGGREGVPANDGESE